MADRVVIGLNGATPVFKVSAPGYDVFTSSEQNTLFDMATDSRYTGSYLFGSTSNTFTSSNTTLAPATNSETNVRERNGSFSVTIPLGKTFSSPPTVFGRMSRGGVYTYPFFQKDLHGFFAPNDTTMVAFFMTAVFSIVATTTSLVITRSVSFESVNAPFSPPYPGFRYNRYETSRNSIRKIVLDAPETYEYMVAQS